MPDRNIRTMADGEGSPTYSLRSNSLMNGKSVEPLDVVSTRTLQCERTRSRWVRTISTMRNKSGDSGEFTNHSRPSSKRTTSDDGFLAVLSIAPNTSSTNPLIYLKLNGKIQIIKWTLFRNLNQKLTSCEHFEAILLQVTSKKCVYRNLKFNNSKLDQKVEVCKWRLSFQTIVLCQLLTCLSCEWRSFGPELCTSWFCRYLVDHAATSLLFARRWCFWRFAIAKTYSNEQ